MKKIEIDILAMKIIIKLIASFGFDTWKSCPVELVDLIHVAYFELSINTIKTDTNFLNLLIVSSYCITKTRQLFLEIIIKRDKLNRVFDIKSKILSAKNIFLF